MIVVSAATGRARRRANVASKSTRQFGCAVVIISHDYGRYLAEAIESVRRQTVKPAEVIVIDDASTDNTVEVARKAGVPVYSIQARNVHYSRGEGLRRTSAEIVCFLDADDVLPADYLERGLPLFADHQVAIVHSDAELFGDLERHNAYPASVDRYEIERRNCLHAGSLVRRDALVQSQAFDYPVEQGKGHDDWFLWRKILESGNWIARKSSAIYRYRQHGTSLKDCTRKSCYYDVAQIGFETVTLFVPLSGRKWAWPRFSQWLESQTWPRTQTRLILFDTSEDAEFGSKVRRWLLSRGGQYVDVRYVVANVGDPGAADQNRRDRTVADRVRLAVARIYNRMALECTTPYVWIVEDDIIPPPDACERLLRGFDPGTDTVSGAYLSRYHAGYVAWDWRGSAREHRYEPGSGYEPIGGHGFGCVMIRRDVLKKTAFTVDPRCPDYDIAFSDRMQQAGGKARICWDVMCEHLQKTGLKAN